MAMRFALGARTYGWVGLAVVIAAALGLGRCDTAGPVLRGARADAGQCQAQPAQLPPWLSTNVYPGRHFLHPDPHEIEFGIEWSEARADDPSVGSSFKRPEVYLDDGSNIVNKATVALTFDFPPSGYTITYEPGSPLEPGLHQVRFVLRDTDDNEFTFEWEFCVDAG